MTTLHLPGYKLDRATFTSTARLSYDPRRGGLKCDTAWWLVANCDPGIGRYYRWWADKRNNPLGLDEGFMKKPIWYPHISVIRGEKPPLDRRHLWKKYEGKELEFKYGVVIHNSGETDSRKTPDIHWYINVDCPELDDIRRELGIYRGIEKYHMTIGKTYVG